MKSSSKFSTKCVFLILLLFMITNARDVSEKFFDSTVASFNSKDSINQRIVRDTGGMNTESEDQDSLTDLRHLTKRNLRALQNTISRVTEAIENLEQKFCQKPDENSTVSAQIAKSAATLENLWTTMPHWIHQIRSDLINHHTEVEKNAAMLDRIEKEIQKYHMEENYNSIFEKVENLEKHNLKRADLQSMENNILHSFQSKLNPSGRNSDCTTTEQKVTYQVTKERLLNYLKGISASRIISGVSVFVHSPPSFGKLVHDMTGIHPGVWSAAMNHKPDLLLQWGSYIEEVIFQWNNQSLVVVQWVACPPTSTESCEGAEITHLRFNTTEWNDLVTDGGRLNKLWKIRLNSMIVPSLKRLESAGVVVIFDPHFLMNDQTYWWAGNLAISGSRRLYQITHDYITKDHNLKSIIWRWSVIHTADLQTYIEQLWPGEEYVDVAALNMWSTKEPSKTVYEKMLQIAGDKPMSMESLYSAPTAEILKQQPRWTWFTVEEFTLKKPEWNNDTNVQAAFENPYVINRGGIDIFAKTNYALQRKATTSSIQNVDVKEDKAIDGNNATRWGSEFSDPQWLQVDLGQLRFVKMIKIFWEGAFATGYLIQISEDKMTWTIVHEENHGTGGLEEILINSPKFARYVKIFGFKRGTGYGYSIFELEVY